MINIHYNIAINEEMAQKRGKKPGGESEPVDRELNQKQRQAVLAPSDPLLIVAGAGTGKTRTLTTRIAYLIKTGVSPGMICALTFTNKAAEEMLERVVNSEARSAKRKQSDDARFAIGDLPFIGTFHSLGARILREAGYILGRKPNFAIFDDDDSFKLIKKLIKGLNFKDARPADLRDKISAFKNRMKGEELEDNRFQKFFDEYEKALLENNAFDFDDLIQKVVLIFRTQPATLARYQKRFSYFLVDEYQDINAIQNEMIKLLAGQKQNLSVVGDYNQILYSWRGSDIEIFLSFERDWPKSQLIFLGENYRSTQNIIEAASALIKNNFQKPAGLKDDALWTRNLKGELLVVKETEDEIGEAEWIANEIAKSKAQIAKEDNRLAISDSQFAILYRTNAQSRALEQALLEEEIPYQIFGGLKFYERREIKDIVAALRYVANSADSLSRERLEKLLRKSGFLRLLTALRDNPAKTPVKIIDIFLKHTNYFDYLDKNFANPDERKENVAGLVAFAGNFENLDEFLERVSLLQATDTTANSKAQSANKPVSLMTIHLAKGLEFDNVFIAGVNEGLLPHHRSMGSQTELEEERRLIYVAMTRARKRLFLSFYDLPSRFLSEIPEEFLEFSGERGLNDEERYITLD